MSKALLAAIAAIALTLPLPALAQLTWGTNGSGGAGIWNSTNTNWYNGTSNVAWVSGDVATFPGISNLGIVHVTGTQTTSELVFLADTGFGQYLFQGGVIQGAAGGLTIQSDAGAGTVINSDITGGPVAVQGSGLLGLGGTLSYIGGLTIANGSSVSLTGSARLATGGVANNGALIFNYTGADVMEENIITGTGTVEFYGTSGVFTLDRANTYGGGTLISPGNSSNTTLEVSQSTVLSTLSGTTTITSGSVGTGLITLFTFNGNYAALEDNGSDITLANSLSLSGSLTFASAGAGSLTFDGTTLSTPATVTVSDTTNLTVNNTTTIADNISGNYSVTQSGTGTLILKGTNSNSVGMEITSGTLLANNTAGSATGTGTFTVGSGAKLGGTGIITSTVNTINGTVQGGAPGMTTTGSLTLTSSGTTTFGSTANLVFNLAAAGGNNKLNVDASPILFANNTLTLNLVDSSTTDYTNGLQYVLIAADGDANQFSGITVDGSNRISGLNLTLVGTATNGQQDSVYYGSSYLVLNNGNIEIEIESVPEPGTWALLLGGLASLAFWKGRRKLSVKTAASTSR